MLDVSANLQSLRVMIGVAMSKLPGPFSSDELVIGDRQRRA